MAERIQNWFRRNEAMTGQGGGEITPRPLSPEAQDPARPTPIPVRPEPRTADGKPLGEGMDRLATAIVCQPGGRPVNEAVKDLQTGLALFERATPDKTKRPALKVDGRFGPKTRKASAETLVSGGRSQVQEALALGGFQRRLAEAAGKPDGEGEVAKALSDTVSPLFMPGGRKGKPAAPSPWGVALQNSVEDLGGARLSPDGQVGRQTSRAVLDATRRAGPEAFGKRFARNLGLLA